MKIKQIDKNNALVYWKNGNTELMIALSVAKIIHKRRGKKKNA